MEHNKETCHVIGCGACDTTARDIIEKYLQQSAENHAILVDKNFWMVVKRKPRWMPMFLYKAIIKELVEFQSIK